MPLPLWMCRSAAAFLLALIAAWGSPSRARAQACCAGGSAVTPARLMTHEGALVGAQLRVGDVHGSYDAGGRYVASPSGDTELDLEQDVFGAIRVLRRGQVALLAPIVETRRAEQGTGAAFGGGIGDVNASVRYDFVVATESLYVPGIALLAGVTLPTGRPPESASPPLFVNSTGIGAWQANVALALEQTYGPWLVNATAIVAKRTPRFGETLGTQITMLGAVAYSFDNGAALAFSASYAFEGDASQDNGQDVSASSKRLTVLALSGLWPMSDTWRLLGGLSLDPPASALGSNQSAVGALTFTVIRSWS
jgi:hypothetical protein